VSYTDKEWLSHQYNELGKTQREIASVCNVTHVTILNWMKNFEIKSRPIGHKTKKGKEGISKAHMKENPTSRSMHEWIANHKTKPDRCEDCHRLKKLELSFDHSLGEYTRNINDYKYLCGSCHQRRDITRRTKYDKI
jgi:hypothetical protein